MPFSPLPATLLKDIASQDADSQILELGSGEGHFLGLLNERGARCWGMDLRHPVGGVVCDIVGDARCAPFKPNSLSLLVAANLLRHLTPRHRHLDYLTHWRRLLRPGGKLYLFEDEPSAGSPAERNFRDLQEFLAQLMPESRGPLLSLDRFKNLISNTADYAEWKFGCQTNEDTIDATAVVRFLAAGEGTLRGKEAALLRAIGRDGVSPGRYWYAQVGPMPGLMPSVGLMPSETGGTK